eukprot:3844442-Rhodomonas_salina.5
MAAGIGVAFTGKDGADLGAFITLSLAMHNVPEGLAVALVLMPRGVSKFSTVLWSIFTSMPQVSLPSFSFSLRSNLREEGKARKVLTASDEKEGKAVLRSGRVVFVCCACAVAAFHASSRCVPAVSSLCRLRMWDAILRCSHARTDRTIAYCVRVWVVGS